MYVSKTTKVFLGIDGGQSHTEAVIADETGKILGIGFGGALNHANLADGRSRLQDALRQSIGEALQKSKLSPLEDFVFAAAHCGLTGGADYKEEIVRQIIKSENLSVGHDALTALYGATAGQAGVVIIAGTDSIVFGMNARNETARAGGLGYLFSDEGGGFRLAVETIKLAVKEQDGVLPSNNLQRLVLDFFRVGEIRELTNDFYNAKISRDEIAKFAETVSNAALAGNEILQKLIRSDAKSLAENVSAVAKRLDFSVDFQVSAVGGMFRSELLKMYFREEQQIKLPNAIFTEPHFEPAVGALLLAYQNSNFEITEETLNSLRQTYLR